MKLNDRVTLKPSYGSSFWTLDRRLILVEHGDQLVVKAKIDRAGEGTRLLVSVLDGAGKDRHHFEIWPAWLEPVVLIDQHPKSGQAFSDLGLGLPITIQTWQDWFRFRNHLSLTFREQSAGYVNWVCLDYQPKYRWVEKPRVKKNEPPNFENVLIPFEVTGMKFATSSFSRFHPKCKIDRTIYISIGVDGEPIEDKLFWI